MTRKSVTVVTGAFDCGKTTTLEWLREHHGLRIHGEAHLRALAEIGDRSAGHPPDRGFFRITDPAHFCPMCRPWQFAELVLEAQREIERSAQPGDLLERGYLDPIEMLLRNTQSPDDGARPTWTTIADYAQVVLFEVMPALQRPRWGKSQAQRVAEAEAINQRLARLYRAAGFSLVTIPPGSVEARAEALLAALAGG
ncbi:ATP-binding protein [Pseudenhygromyxa sp. WMMC2535]|uniref:ATP/GTP-binding protein n=1 Tax=Pseudenhygromyxa sp. WMMC2535 TaxID=2712867 RepID=UPI0015556A9D|nr:ATP-binding protein [Pseudenhygromyxa sp. WMMC2535]NVB43141.1 ATP-binding protein [Pseudenhygromyxa sp. WMMC2535]NVB43782.1 ATP-binding protein [Pseudenhygromyxa sp. WMMC2535]